MSVSSDRGLAFERVVRKMTARVLKLDIKRDLQSGAGIHKQDIRDRFRELPIFIECKDHQTIKPKEWWREANNKAVVGEAPVVVFPDNEEVLCVMRYSDLLQLIKEGRDWYEAYNTLLQTGPMTDEKITSVSQRMDGENVHLMSEDELPAPIHPRRAGQGCGNGHIVIDQFGHCQTKGCQFSRGYAIKKKAKQNFNKQ